MKKTLVLMLTMLTTAGCAATGRSSDQLDSGLPDVQGLPCGDGLPSGSEGCDDGNLLAGDGCSSQCLVEAGWFCSGTPSSCVMLCGNGLIDGTEQCDGVLLNGNDCTTVPGGFSDGTLACTEDCQLDITGCVLTSCGNGVVDSGEECDDGNLTNGDGCEASCQLTCAAGTQQPCGSCGTRTCGVDHQWSVCEEYCDGRVCGPDACGGSCGSCVWWESCDAAGQCTSPCVSPPCVASVGDHPDVYAALSHASSTCAAWSTWTLANACTASAPITGCDDGTPCGSLCLDTCGNCQCSNPAWCPQVDTCTNCVSPFLAVDPLAEHAWPTFAAGTLVAASGFNNDWVFHYYFQEPTAPKPSVCLLEPSVGYGCLEHPCGSGVCIPNTIIHLADYSQQAFHLEVLQDGNRLVLLANSWVAHGGIAAATYFESTMASNLAGYSDRWYVYLWEDSDFDDYPDPPGIDTYTLLTSGN